MTFSWEEVFLNTVSDLVEEQRSCGSLKPGWNGPWKNPETPVRNTAHALCSFSKAYDITDKEKFREAAENALDFLLREDFRPFGNYVCRIDSNSNLQNGLIGQAWAMEGLIYVYKYCGLDEGLEVAKEVFEFHDFDKKRGLYVNTDINGEGKGIHKTLNQQIWMAYIGSELEQISGEKFDSIDVFFDKIEDNMSLFENGLIQHMVPSRFLLGRILEKKKRGNSLKERSVGYHSFILYGLAELFQNRPEEGFWKSDKFEKIKKYTLEDYYEETLDNKFCYLYNPTGLEIDYFFKVFDLKGSEKFLEKQREKTVNGEAFGEGTKYENILKTRVYEKCLIY